MDKIIGLGNALVDVLAPIKDDKILSELALPKGSMTWVEGDKLQRINDYLRKSDAKQVPGGSAGNTIRALAHLGAATGFIGKVGNDAFGDFYRNSLLGNGVDSKLIISSDLPSGVAATFISPDGERTFGDHLGAAATLHADEMSLEMFRGYTYLYIEGYLVQDHDLILRAIEFAKEAGLQVCLDMASYNIVEEEHEFFSLLVNKYVDIVFANEEESYAFTHKAPEEALEEIAGKCSIAVVKVGPHGSLIRKGTETIQVPASAAVKRIDSTGAGDYYAAGFLYGLTRGMPLEHCARIGSLLSEEIIQVVGAELPESTWEKIRKEIEE